MMEEQDLNLEKLKKKNNSSSSIEDVRKLQLDLKKNGKKHKKYRKVRLSRSWWGDLILIVILCGFALFSAYPLVYAICNAFKPLSEMFIFPPKLFPRNFTFENFIDLFNLMGNSHHKK